MKQEIEQQLNNSKFSWFKNTWVIIVISVIITAIIVGGGIYWWQKASAEKLQEQIIDLQNQISEVGDQISENWQTYRNEEYGFEVKYPEDWNITQESTVKNPLFSVRDKNYYFNVWPISMSVGIGLNAAKTSEEDIALLGSNLVRELYSTTDGEEFYRIEFPKSRDRDYVYTIEYPNLNKALFNQILSTFKFTEKDTIDTSNWQMYRNEEYGLEVKYPGNWPYATFKKGEFFAGGAYPGGTASWRLYLGSKIDLNCYDTGEGHPYYFEGYQYSKEEQEQIKTTLLANNPSRSLTNYYKKDIVNGNEIIWYIEGGEGSECGGAKAMIFGKDKDYIVRFTVVIRHGQKEDEPKEFNQILSTFKFIEKDEVSIDGWQTYQNEKYGFEFQYPQNWKIAEESNMNRVTFFANKNLLLIYIPFPEVGLEPWVITKTKIYPTNDPETNLSYAFLEVSEEWKGKSSNNQIHLAWFRGDNGTDWKEGIWKGDFFTETGLIVYGINDNNAVEAEKTMDTLAKSFKFIEK